MSSIPQSLNQSKDYDVRDISIALGGAAVTDIAQVGWSGSKDHEKVYTPDNNLIWVHNSPDITGTIAVHNTSPTIPAAISAWKNEDSITITLNTPDDAGYDGAQFRYCKVTDVSPAEESIDEMPDFTIDFSAGDMR